MVDVEKMENIDEALTIAVDNSKKALKVLI